MIKGIERFVVNKYSMFTLLGIICVLFIFAANKYYSYQIKIIHNEAHDHLKAIAGLKISQISGWNNERLTDAKSFSQSLYFIDGLERWLENKTNNNLKTKLEENLSLINSSRIYNSVAISDTSGNIQLFSNSNIQKNDTELLKAIKKASIEKEIVSTNLYTHQHKKTICLDYIAPIISGKNKIIAIMIFSINLSEYLYPLINDWPALSKTSETLIVQKEGDSIIVLNELRFQKNATIRLKLPLKSKSIPAMQVAQGSKGAVEGKDYKGAEVLAYIEPIPNTQWVIVAKVDHREIYQDLYLREKVIITFIIIILIFLVLGLILFFQYRQRKIYKKLFIKEKELRAYHEEYKTILYSIGDGVITTDSKGRVSKMNMVAEQLTGWTESEAEGRRIEQVFKIVNEETQEEIESPVYKFLAQGVIIGLENHTLLISKSGNGVSIADSVAPIKNDEGKITGVILVFRDQSEERFAAKLLRSRLAIVEYAVSHTTEELLQKTLEEVCRLTQSSVGFYHSVESDQITIFPQGYSGVNLKEFCSLESQGLYYSIEKAGTLKDCLFARKPIIHNDCASLHHENDMPKEHSQVIRELLVPVLRSEKVVAILGVGNKSSSYINEDIEIVSFLSDVAWEVISKKRNEDAIRVSETRLSRAELASKSGNWELHMSTKTIIASKGARALYGFDQEVFDYEMIKKSPLSEYRPMLDVALKNLIESDEPYNVEFKIKSADTGEIKDIHSIAYFDREKETLFGVVQDITERKRAETRLKRSEQRYELLFNSSNDGVFVNEVNDSGIGKFTEVNDVACNRLGYSRAQLQQMTLKDVDAEGMDEARLNAFDSISKSGQAVFDMIHVSRTGQKIPVEISCCLFESEGSRYIMSIARDITNRMQAEKDIKQLLERFNLASQAAKLGVWDWDAKKNLMVWDERMYQLYGIQEEHFSGSIDAWENGLHPDDFKRSCNDFEMALSGKKPFDTEFRVLWPNGTVRYLKAYAQVVRNGSGEPLRMIGVNYDITDKKNAEETLIQLNEQLKKLNATKDKLFSIVAHDLKSPFTGILGFSELLYENLDKYKAEKIKHFVEQISLTAKSTFILLENLLTWAKSQTGQIEFKPQTLRLQSIVNDVINVFGSSAKIKNISLNAYQSNEIMVYADQNMLHTILRNLVSNAIKFTKSGGRIDIFAILDKGNVEITVKDNGVGMNAEAQNKLFKKDLNVTTKGTAEEGGTGLGLILCKDFVEKQGGKIYFESEEGKGSEFKITLPVM